MELLAVARADTAERPDRINMSSTNRSHTLDLLCTRVPHATVHTSSR